MCRFPAICALLSAFWVSAAAAQQPTAPPPAATVQVAVEPGTVPTPQQVLAIPPALRQMLRSQVSGRWNSREQRLQSLVAMIFSSQGMDLQYDANATYTVSEIWQQRRANCLSFTLMFVTLAREAGIKARVQEVDRVVSWYQDQDQGVVYSVGHVNASVLVDGRNGTVDLDRNVLYDRRGPHPITTERALAHFYNNRGAERLAAHDRAGAQAFFDAALAQDPSFAAAWNNIGVLRSRDGDLAAARRALEIALQLEPRHDSALSNLAALYRQLGLPSQASGLERQLRSAQREDPFVQYMLGAQAERNDDLPRAIYYYRRAVRLYDSAHQFHFGLARAYFRSGQVQRADRELLRAQQLGGAPEQARYQAKLDSLARWRAQQQAQR
ncbi:tetratricopeptide repeat protein [Stenotrophomonas sp. YAU14D1_LEIMI4_1]|uniref:tetratricopeptide repeat protein n=1 Tax=Stenotrophomonas sp. YAU14D1_LEIMI4_1 TaxID=2072407 RepID=UPI000D54282A|nr:tetratricopeptide repeat protein [Stenotrophomonas sp. YAU14D1_LEIMI4_1]AWH26141.1 UDP-N-acetylglucosamine-peptide N-acetylglucosaminyltransferase [Stenotrophomonas sp. YAU14D1_LEIMI4_1]